MSGGMTVRRVDDATGSHIEPPLDQKWTHLEKLAWLSAVVREDAGLEVRVTQRGRHFSISGRGFGCGPFTFDTAWAYITGMASGASEARASEGVQP